MLANIITVLFLILCVTGCLWLFFAYPLIAIIAGGIIGGTMLLGFLANALDLEESKPRYA